MSIKEVYIVCLHAHSSDMDNIFQLGIFLTPEEAWNLIVEYINDVIATNTSYLDISLDESEVCVATFCSWENLFVERSKIGRRYPDKPLVSYIDYKPELVPPPASISVPIYSNDEYEDEE